MAIKSDYKNYVPPVTGRKFQMTQNSDGTVSLEDVTPYAQVGDIWGAGDANTFAGGINNLDGRTNGVYVEIANKDVTIPASAWSYNAAEMRHEATITDAAIKASTDVKLSVPDERNGKVVLGALRPAAGHIVVYTTDANTAAQSLTLRMAVTEVRRTEVAE